MGRSSFPRTPCMRLRIDAVVAFDHILPTLPMGGREDVDKIVVALGKVVTVIPGCVGLPPGGTAVQFSLDKRFTKEDLERYLAAKAAEEAASKRRLHNYVRRRGKLERCEHCGVARRACGTRGTYEYLPAGADPKKAGSWTKTRPNCTGSRKAGTR